MGIPGGAKWRPDFELERYLKMLSVNFSVNNFSVNCQINITEVISVNTQSKQQFGKSSEFDRFPEDNTIGVKKLLKAMFAKNYDKKIDNSQGCSFLKSTQYLTAVWRIFGGYSFSTRKSIGLLELLNILWIFTVLAGVLSLYLKMFASYNELQNTFNSQTSIILFQAFGVLRLLILTCNVLFNLAGRRKVTRLINATEDVMADLGREALRSTTRMAACWYLLIVLMDSACGQGVFSSSQGVFSSISGETEGYIVTVLVFVYFSTCTKWSIFVTYIICDLIHKYFAKLQKKCLQIVKENTWRNDSTVAPLSAALQGAENLDEVKNRYMKLVKLTRLTEQTFSYILVLSVLQETLFLVAGLYLCIADSLPICLADEEWENRKPGCIMAGTGILLAIGGLLNLTLLTMIGSRLIEKAKAVVDPFLLDAQTEDHCLQTQVQNFILQINHLDVSMSPGGLFTLRKALLPSIMGAAVTYIVVAIQFRNSAK